MARVIASNETLFARACEVMPGGVSSPVRAFGAVGGTPRFIASGAGARMTDVDGRTYIDLLGSWGPLILGHAHPVVVEAIERAARAGTSFGAPTAAEVDLAELVMDALPSIEMLRFVSSGTEAVMSAVRLARGATGREMVLKFDGCYHGHADALLVTPGSGPATLGSPGSAGVPAAAAASTISVPYNDTAAALDALERFGDRIACVIVEPIAANMGCVAPAAGFLEALRDGCDRTGALLIFDEVVTGFRVGWHGAQGATGVRPDLTVLGKILGGGLPVGAYGGRRDIMAHVAPIGPVYQAGTLSGNPIGMAAGLATLQELRRTDPYERLDRMGAALEQGLQDAAAAAGVALTVQRVASMLTPFFTGEPVRDFADAQRCDRERFVAFFNASLEAGIYWPPSPFETAMISTAHTDQDVAAVVEAARAAWEDPT